MVMGSNSKAKTEHISFLQFFVQIRETIMNITSKTGQITSKLKGLNNIFNKFKDSNTFQIFLLRMLFSSFSFGIRQKIIITIFYSFQSKLSKKL